uniref:Uncharacterized protein n=1 Tax=Sinocyclocheilus rhinocerous TaxID=307959 RepID=A0A673JMD1_9TELE
MTSTISRSKKLNVFCLPFTFLLHRYGLLAGHPEEFPAKLENSELFERIEKFVQVHRNSFLLLQAPVYGKREWEILSSVQNRCIMNGKLQMYNLTLKAKPLRLRSTQTQNKMPFRKQQLSPFQF